MNHTEAMVMEKKGAGSMSTFTRAAVRAKRNRMASRLPRIRTASGMLPVGAEWATAGHQGSRAFLALRAGRSTMGRDATHHWYRKELSSVKSSRGSWDSSVTQLLKLKESAVPVWLVPASVVLMLAPDNRPWKYCQDMPGEGRGTVGSP